MIFRYVQKRVKTIGKIMVFAMLVINIMSIAACSNLDSEFEESQTGQIFLYGEEHAVEIILQEELQRWDKHYQNGIRDLFIEYPYYTAEYLNIWMKSKNDDILNEVYEDWKGTQGYSELVKQFFLTIKDEYPETVFHGTDVGHNYDSTGKRYLEYLQSIGQQNSEEYKLAEEIIEQGKCFYKNSDMAYRENKMSENFIREYEKLNRASVMGIYGAAHTRFGEMDSTNTVPNMASQLKEKYGDSIVKTEDLSGLTKNINPIEIEKIIIAGKEYEAAYYYKEDISSFLTEYQYRKFWRVENAYEDLKNNRVTGDTLPYSNYPMNVDDRQVFVIDYIKTDGTTERKYYRADGNTFQGELTTEEFRAD